MYKEKLSLPHFIRELKYRSQVVWACRLVFFFDIIIAVCLCGVIFLTWNKLKFGPEGFVGIKYVVLYSLIVFYLIASHLIRRFFFKPLATSIVDVFKDKVRVKNNRKEYEVLFSDIKQVKFKVTFIGGWISLITHSGKKFRFTSVLERPEYLVQALYDYNKDFINENKFKHYIETLVSFDHFQARIYSFFKKEKKYIGSIIFFIPPVLGVLACYLVQKSKFFIYDKLSYFFETTSFVILIVTVVVFFFCTLTEIFIRIRVNKLRAQNLMPDGPSDRRIVKKTQEDKRRYVSVENKIYRITAPFYAVCMVLALVFTCYLDLNLMNSTKASQDFSEINLSKGQKYWWYSYPRFNSSLQVDFKVGDYIVLLNDKVVKVVGVEDEYLFVKIKTRIGNLKKEIESLVIKKKFIKGRVLTSCPWTD